MNSLFKSLLIFAFIELSFTQTIKLPDPIKTGGMPLYEAFSKRQSHRSFNPDAAGDLTDQQISQLLWGCYGLNRDDGGKVVPSAIAAYPFDVYAFMKSGVYFYDPESHSLTKKIEGDFRGKTGYDDFVQNAYLNVCLVGSYERESALPKDQQAKAMELDAGFSTMMMGEVCSAEQLKCVPRAGIDTNTIVELLGLSKEEFYVPLCFSAGK